MYLRNVISYLYLYFVIFAILESLKSHDRVIMIIDAKQVTNIDDSRV